MKTAKFLIALAGIFLIAASILISCKNTTKKTNEQAKADSTLVSVQAVDGWTCIKGDQVVFTNVPDTLSRLNSLGYKMVKNQTSNIHDQNGHKGFPSTTVHYSLQPQGYWYCTGKNNDPGSMRTTTQYTQASNWVKFENSQCVYISGQDSIH